MQLEALYETPTLRCNLRVLCSGGLGALSHLLCLLRNPTLSVKLVPLNDCDP